eukprot:Clim_evm158s157 gene=Clim_evmTU158s157
MLRLASTTARMGRRAMAPRVMQQVSRLSTTAVMRAEARDPRDVRFVDQEKQFNSNPAMNITRDEPVYVSNKRVVGCEGGHAALGHPLKFINLDQPRVHSCGYCGREFVYKGHKSLIADLSKTAQLEN